jgi:curved DNA-binding protein CbpA
MDPYAILKIEESATQEEVRNAWRKAANLHHPDKGGSHAIFIELNHAFEILGNPEKRRAYDQVKRKRPVENARDEFLSLARKFMQKCTNTQPLPS